MPGAAIATGAVDFVLPLEEIAPALITLVGKGQVP
jgi:chemotaxis response regulator CheB